MMTLLALMLIVTAALYVVYRHRHASWHKRHQRSEKKHFTFKI